jgi:signal transduction histidine kinase
MELFGFESEKDFEGISLINIAQNEGNDVTRECYFEIINNKQTEVSFEESIINKNGERLILHNVSAYCVYEKKDAILTTMSDITPVKQVIELKEDVKKNVELLNESLEYNKYITEFFANISHELKTPLNIIFSSVQILNLYNENFQPDIQKKREDYLDIMKQNCYRLTRLINNILDMTKLDAGFIKPKMKNKDIVSEVESIVMSIIPYAESKGVKIIFDTDEEERIMAFDTDKIERIMLNLLSNALKFTNQGGYIYINIYNEEDTVSISVKDTGIGIPEDKLELIFERFMQVDKSLKRNHEGTGIGLSLVKSFVELHRGNIKVSSKINEGSEFTITFPVKEIEEQDIMEPEIKGNFSEKISLELSDIYLDIYKNL